MNNLCGHKSRRTVYILTINVYILEARGWRNKKVLLTVDVIKEWTGHCSCGGAIRMICKDILANIAIHPHVCRNSVSRQNPCCMNCIFRFIVNAGEACGGVRIAFDLIIICYCPTDNQITQSRAYSRIPTRECIIVFCVSNGAVVPTGNKPVMA